MREAKGELTQKDMSVVREMDDAKTQSKKSFGILKDYSLQHRVTMQWDLNDDAKRDMMFKLTIDDKEVILDWEEMQRYGRWI